MHAGSAASRLPVAFDLVRVAGCLVLEGCWRLEPRWKLLPYLTRVSGLRSPGRRPSGPGRHDI